MQKPKIFACYERNFSRDWKLVCYHDSKPQKSVNSSDRERTDYYNVPDDQIDDFGNPLYGAIVNSFPAPAN